MSTRLQGRTRWSAAAKCPRWAVLGYMGAEPAEPTDRQRRLWERGKQLGAWVAGRYKEQHGADQVILEKAVPWPDHGLPLGELHTDVFVITDGLAVEVKSSTAPDSLLDSAFLQLAGEVRFDPDARNGVLHIVNPSDLSEDILPFVLNDEWRDRVDALAAIVAGCAREGTLPPCSQSSPGACRMVGCPYTDLAWEGWQPDEAGVLNGEALELARSMYEVQLQRRAAKAVYDEASDRWKELCGSLAEMVPGGRYAAGPLLVVGTPHKGRETFALAKARKSGVWTPGHDEAFGPFLSLSDGHVRWRVERSGDGPLIDPDEFGEDAPF